MGRASQGIVPSPCKAIFSGRSLRELLLPASSLNLKIGVRGIITVFQTRPLSHLGLSLYPDFQIGGPGRSCAQPVLCVVCCMLVMVNHSASVELMVHCLPQDLEAFLFLSLSRHLAL